jgi:hypothetical protein
MKPIMFHLGDQMVDPLKLTRQQFQPHIVADALSHIIRYSGMGLFKISVAQHSTVLAQHVPDHLKLAALTHDVPEIFCGDVNGPVLRQLGPRIDDFQNEILKRLAEIFNIPHTDYMEISTFDRRISTDEREAIFPNHSAWKSESTYKALGAKFTNQHPWQAANDWLEAFSQCITIQRWQADDVASAGVVVPLRRGGDDLRGSQV